MSTVLKKIIETKNAPTAIGTYSQGVVSNNMLFISGQIPLDPATGEMVSDDFIAQAHRVFQSVVAVAQAADASLDNAVKLSVYLTDLNDFAALNQVMPEYVKTPFPSRAVIEVKGLPRGAKIEIDGIIALS